MVRTKSTNSPVDRLVTPGIDYSQRFDRDLGQAAIHLLMNRLPTDFFVSRMSFLTGAGSILALFGNYYEFNRSSTEAEADALAICSDWLNTGNDIRVAIEKVRLEIDAEQLSLPFLEQAK